MWSWSLTYSQSFQICLQPRLLSPFIKDWYRFHMESTRVPAPCLMGWMNSPHQEPAPPHNMFSLLRPGKIKVSLPKAPVFGPGPSRLRTAQWVQNPHGYCHFLRPIYPSPSGKFPKLKSKEGGRENLCVCVCVFVQFCPRDLNSNILLI